MRLDASAQTELLALARLTLDAYISTGVTPRYHTMRPELCVKRGLFVSLHKGHELRGCIGQITPDHEIHTTVQRCVISAAVDDTRFEPVRLLELREINIEISILTPLALL